MDGFDPQAPLIGKDGLEYACFADKILGEPIDSWRNAEILTRRGQGQNEKIIRTWIRAYDGSDYTPGECSTRARQIRARTASSYHTLDF
jgi:hypothetical protein